MNYLSCFFFSLFLLSNLLSSNIFAKELPDIIAVYLTWQHSPEKTMTIQWLSDSNDTDDQVSYKTIDATEWKTSTGTHVSIEEKQSYFIHRIELENLSPGTTYNFHLANKNTIYKFRTMPLNLNEPVRFVEGGDIYHDSLEELKAMNEHAAKTDPHFALLGGDIAYGSKDLNRWIKFLQLWSQTMITPSGHLIPMITTIGNHDVRGGYGKNPDKAKYYYAFFPTPENQCYHVVDFSNYMSIIILDSGHTHPVEGTQTNWLSKTLGERASIPYKFALYHVGAYPSVRTLDRELNTSVRTNWVPLFEQHKLHTAFEHHDHAYKRTHIIKNNKIDPSGILYIGDGAWGVSEGKSSNEKIDRWYLAKTSTSSHIIQVTVSKDGTNFRVIDNKGQIFDEFSRGPIN